MKQVMRKKSKGMTWKRTNKNKKGKMRTLRKTNAMERRLWKKKERRHR